MRSSSGSPQWEQRIAVGFDLHFAALSLQMGHLFLAHRAPDRGIEFHCEHPSSPMPRMDIEKAQLDRYTLAPPSGRRSNAGSVADSAAAIYNVRPKGFG